MFKGLATDGNVPRAYEDLVEPHVASFDYFISHGLGKVVESLKPVEVVAQAQGFILHQPQSKF